MTGYSRFETASETARSREQWIDVARGIGIVLVVFGHVWRGLDEADLVADEAAFKVVDNAIYLFHMPLFFVISGMLFKHGVQFRGIWGSFIARSFTIAYPYLLWSYLNMFTKYFVDNNLNTSVYIDQVFHAYYPPVMQFWFLFHLFFIQTVLSFSFLSKFHYFKINFGIACIAALIGQASGAGDVLPAAVLSILPNFVFFVLGMAIAEGPRVLPRATPWALCAAVAAFGAAQLAFAFLPAPAGSAARPVLAVACVVAVLIASKFLAGLSGRIAAIAIRPLAALGMAAMAVYVAHVLFTAGVRIALEQVGSANVLAHSMLGLAAGLAAPYALFCVARSYGVLWLAGFGAAPRLVRSARL